MTPRADVTHHWAGRGGKPASEEYIRKLWERVNALIAAEREADTLRMAEAAAVIDEPDYADIAEKERDARLEVSCARYGG